MSLLKVNSLATMTNFWKMMIIIRFSKKSFLKHNDLENIVN